MDTPCLVLSTVPSRDSGATLAASLVEKGLAACVNMLPGVESIYRWQGEICHTDEVLLIIKTSSGTYPDLETALRASHPYELPEIVAIPITAGSRDYLDWILDSVRRTL